MTVITGRAPDPRSIRTRSGLRSALLSGLEEKHLDEITVAGLCARAQVSRMTFYRHWSDLTSFVTDVSLELVDAAIAVDEEALRAARTERDMLEVYRSVLVGEFTHVRELRGLYRSLLASTNGSFRRALHEVLAARTRISLSHWRRMGIAADTSPIAVSYMAAGMSAAFEHWARSDDDDDLAAARETEAQYPSWWPGHSVSWTG